MGFFFLFGALLISVGSKLLYKKAVHAAPVFFTAFLTQILGGIIMYAYYLAFGGTQETNWTLVWPYLLLSVGLWTIIAVWSLIGIRDTEVSLREVLTQSRTLIVVVLSVLILGETVALRSWIGVFLILAGIAIAVYKPGKKLHHADYKGAWIVLATSALIAIISLVDKKMAMLMDPALYSAIVYAGPALCLVPFFTGTRVTESVDSLRNGTWKIAAVVGMLNSIGFLLTLYTYRSFDLHIAYPLLQLSSLVVLLAGVVFWHEKQRVQWKILGFALALAGAFVIKW